MAFTPKEVIEILTRAQQLGASSVRVNGLEVSFGGRLSTLPLIAPTSEPSDHLPHGSPDWHAFRRRGLGGSDAPVITGKTPREWSTKLKLWELKTHRRQPDRPNWPMKRGLRLEPFARDRYQDMTGVAMPRVARIHPKYDFLRVNADGVNFALGGGLEIKCPGKEDHAKALDGEIPEKYLDQLIHTMYVLDLDWIDYFSFYPRTPNSRVTFRQETATIRVDRKKSRERKLIPLEKQFWEEHIVKDIPPEPDPEPVQPPQRTTLRLIDGKKLIDPFRTRQNMGDR